MEVLAFTVINKKIECDIKQVVGDNDYQASFMLDNEWNDKEVICRVVWNNRTSLDIALEDLSCVIPAYIMKRGEVSIGVYAEGDEQLTTEPWLLSVRKSIREKEFETAMPHKEIWNEINEKIKNVTTNNDLDEKVVLSVNDAIEKLGLVKNEELNDKVNTQVNAYLLEDIDGRINELLDEKNIISIIEVDGKNLVNQNDENFVVGHLLKDGSVNSSATNYRTTGYIFVPSGKSVVCSPKIRQFLAYTLEKKIIAESAIDIKTTNYIYTATEDCYIRATLFLTDIDSFQIEYGTAPTDYVPYQKEYTFDDNVKNIILNISKNSQDLSSGNVLYGKKWAVCGDSFSNGDFNNALDTNYTIEEGIYRGHNKVYGYLIGNRNNMNIQNLSLGGRTMGLPSDHETTGFTNSFINYYQSIDEDVDYITLYFGINDGHHLNGDSGSDGEDVTGVIPIGTLDDTTTDTFCGAYQTVLDWIIVNRPNAKIGIIVTNGLPNTTEYRDKTIAIAKKYGIPYIDLNGDERTPAMHRTCNPDIATSVKQALMNKWSVNPGSNTHPNAKAHEYMSFIIENFLRSL